MHILRKTEMKLTVTYPFVFKQIVNPKLTRCEDLRWTGHNNVSEEPYFHSHSSNHIYIQGSVILCMERLHEMV